MHSSGSVPIQAIDIWGASTSKRGVDAFKGGNEVCTSKKKDVAISLMRPLNPYSFDDILQCPK